MHLWQYYLYFGDLQLLKELYPVLVNINQWFSRHLSHRGLLNASWRNPVKEGIMGTMWPWIDWGHRLGRNAPGQKLGEMAALDAMYFKFLMDASKIARATGQLVDSQRFEQDAMKLKDAINDAYWDQEKGFYWDDVERTIRGDQASVLAVLYGIAPRDQWRRIFSQSLDADYRVGQSSPNFYYFVLDALAEAGMYDQALETMRKRWGDMIAQGATSTWEVWELREFAPRPGELHRRSLCHAYGANPTYILSSRVLGVRPIEAGFSKFELAPHPGDLKWANGTMPTPLGDIRVSWKRNPKEGFTLSMDAPAGAIGFVHVPLQNGKEIYLNGAPIWRNGQLAISDPRVKNARALDDRVVFEVDSGAYYFVSR